MQFTKGPYHLGPLFIGATHAQLDTVTVLNRFRTAGSGIGVFGTLRNIEVPDNTAAYAGSPGCLPSLKPPATSLEAKAQ
ncbi:hypothetical protein H4I96_06383 [Botrytis cinerea]